MGRAIWRPGYTHEVEVHVVVARKGVIFKDEADIYGIIKVWLLNLSKSQQ